MRILQECMDGERRQKRRSADRVRGGRRNDSFSSYWTAFGGRLGVGIDSVTCKKEERNALSATCEHSLKRAVYNTPSNAA